MNTAARRARILEAARQVALRYGYRKTTLEDVAAAAGVSRATVYNHFPNKEEIFRSVVTAEIERFRQALAAAWDPAAAPDERLLGLVRARFGHLRQLRELYAMALDGARETLPVVKDELQAFEAEQLAALEALLREGMETGRFCEIDAPALAAALLAALRGLDEALIFEGNERVAVGAVGLVEATLRGLRVRP